MSPPTGDVTLVFTDIEGSTKLWQRYPRAFESVLAIHHRVIRACIQAEGGYEVKTEGDAFMVAFSDPVSAVNFCVAAQLALHETVWPIVLEQSSDNSLKGLRVRMGIHTGTPSCAIDPVTQRMDYYGLMVNRAARITHAAMGGQILVSREAHDTIDWEGLEVVRVDLGPKPLRDLNEATHLHQVLPASLAERSFEQPRPSRIWRTNLVAAPDTFVGRTSELEQVAGHLGGGTRLLTIVGAGGTGKTRLACQFGHERVSDFEGGVWFADLSQATSAEEICQCVGDALGIPLTGRDPFEQIGNAIMGRGRTLIMLDNFEQLVQSAPATLGLWMGVAPLAFFMVTSRERLRLPGEHLLYLDPLGTDEAVTLFEARARSVRPGFVITDANRKTVEEIVHRLDCMSLAIELAAARSSILQPEQLLQRLSQRFRLLRGRSQDGPHRQATLRNAIDWSWKLLEPCEREALAQLSVFSSSLTLEAAESVLDLDEFPHAPWPMDVVESLHDKSLLRLYRTDSGVGDQFGMYQSVAEYAAEKLAESPEGEESARRRHMNYFAALCHEVGQGKNHPLRGAARLKSAYLNIVRAFDTAVSVEEPKAAGQTALGVLSVLNMRGPYEQAVEKAERFLALPGAFKGDKAKVFCCWLNARRHLASVAHCVPRLEEALQWAMDDVDYDAEMRCRKHLIRLAADLGDHELVIQHIQVGLERCEEVRKPQYAFGFHDALSDYHLDRGDLVRSQESLETAAYLVKAHQLSDQVGRIAHKRGRFHEDQGKLTEARLSFEQSLSAYIEMGDMRGQSIILGCLANIHRIQGRYEEAKTHYEAALRIHRDWGNPISAAMVQGNMGNLYKELGKLEEAQRLYRESGAAFRALGRKQNEAISLGNQGELLIQMGRISEAREVLERSVSLCNELEFKAEGAFLTYLARVERLESKLDQAAVVLQRGERLLRSSGQRYHLGILLSERGLWALETGDVGRARQAWADAQKISTDLEANPRSELGTAVDGLRQALERVT